MILVRQFDRGIGKRTAALVRVGKMAGHLCEPGVQLRQRIARVRPVEPLPAAIRLPRGLAQIFGHQFILGSKVTIERHLVGAGRLGDRINAYSPDSMPVKKLLGSPEDAFAGWNSCVFIKCYGRLGIHLKISS